MTFPESDRVVYAVHTLAEVACQLNFPPILSITTEQPAALQARLRDDYPLYDTIEPPGAPKELVQLIARLPGQPPQSLQHRFTTADGNRSIILGPRLLAITEKDYVEWPTFRADIEAARHAVEDVYRPAFYQRVGLRYQDVIDATIAPGTPWHELINPSLIGLLGAPEPDIRNAVTAAAANVALKLDGATEAFVHINHGLARNLESDDERAYLVDADYFTEQQTNGGEINKLLDYFNVEAGRLFRWAISDAARRALGRRDDVAIHHEPG